MEHGTHSTQGCKKASGKEVGKKLQRTENPLLQQTSLGWSLMPWQETAPSSRQAMHWLAAIPTPQNCRTRWFTSRYRFHCQNCPTRVASLLGSEEQQYTLRTAPNPLPRQSALEQVLGGWHNFIRKLQLFPLLIETHFKYFPGAACRCPTLGLKPQKSWKTEQETRKEKDSSAWPDALVRFVPLGCQLTLSSNSSQGSGAEWGSTPSAAGQKSCTEEWDRPRRRSLHSSPWEHAAEAKQPHTVRPQGVTYSRGKGLQVWNHYSFETQTHSKEHSSGCSQHIISFQWHLPSNCWDGL